MKIDPETWPILSQLLDEWLDLRPEVRSSWLKSLGPEYADVLPALRELLATQAIGGADTFLNALPALSGAGEYATAGFAVGLQIGPYRLARELGHGGMGVVWLAERADGALRRLVALKLPAIPLHEGGLSERFARERDILAQLTHPNIARLYDAGMAYSGQPYLALEYVDGEAITAYCDRQVLGVKARLQLLLDVLRAVQYAHANLVVHRDLKPSNIMVTGEGEVRLLDFGIAKLLTAGEARETELTRLEGRALTPDYASPEQITGDPVTTASDVYSLGVVLYELLTGERPYRLKRDTRGSLEEAILSADVARPGQVCRDDDKARVRALTPKRLARTLQGDLDTIVLKALQKQPSQRYSTADAFAQDIQRYLRGEAVLAQPESVWYRGRKFVLRNMLAVASAGGVVMALAVGLSVALWEIRAARLEQKRADTQEATAQAVNQFLENDLLAQASPNSASASDNPDPDLKVRTALDRAAQRIPGKFDKQPLVEASIRQTISHAYGDLGLYSEAQRQVERTIELRSKILGKTHRDTLISLNWLAELYTDQLKFSQAEALYSEVLEAQRRVFGEQDADTIHTMAGLAVAKRSQRKLVEAEQLNLKALALSRRVLGENHSETLTIMNNLGPLYENEKRYPEALSILTRALEIKRIVLGEEHPDTILSTYNLGTIELYYGKYAQAWPLLVKAHEVWPRVLGEEHPYSLMSLSVLGTYNLYLGRYQQAEEINTKLLELRRRAQGEDHPSTLLTAMQLGLVYAHLGRYSEAQRLLDQVLLAQPRAVNWDSLQASTALAYLDVQMGKEAEAEQLYRTALASQLRVLGEDNPNTLDSMSYLGALYQRRGNDVEAEQLLSKALELRRRTAAPENVFLADTRLALGYRRFQQQMYSEAESLLRDALVGYEKAGSESWLRYQAQVLLGQTLVYQRRYNEAESLLTSGRQGMVKRRTMLPVYGRAIVKQSEAWLARARELATSYGPNN